MATYRVALVQARPHVLNLQASLEKALDLIGQAARQGAQLVAFAEGWLSGYPAWIDHCPDIARWDDPPTRVVFRKLWENSLDLNGPEAIRLAQAASDHQLYLVMGANERTPLGPGPGTVYNSLITYGPDGKLINHHRKLMPTFNERMFHGRGDGRGLKVIQAGAARIGGLICWEHWMPLSRQALHQQGEDIHIAAWPHCLDRHLLASRSYAFEGRAFVLAVGQIQYVEDIPDELRLPKNLQGKAKDFLLRGGSAVIRPDGSFLLEPQYDKEDIYLCELELNEVIEGRLTLDVGGHYHRPDVFNFEIKAMDQ